MTENREGSMAVVRDLHMPPPRIDNDNSSNKKQEPEKRPPDEVDELMVATMKGAKLKAFQQAAGITEQRNQIPVKSEEKTDISAIVKSQNELVGTLIQQLSGANKPSSGNDVLTTYLIQELKDAKAMMQGSNPMEGVAQSLQVVEALKNYFGFDKEKPVVPQVVDVNAQIQLASLKNTFDLQMKQLEETIANNTRNFEVLLKKMEHQFALELEDRKTENQIRLAAMIESRKGDGERSEAFQGMAASIISALSGGGEQEVPRAAPVREAPLQNNDINYQVKEFKCEGCGTLINIPDDKDVFYCPNPDCGMEYDKGVMD